MSTSRLPLLPASCHERRTFCAAGACLTISALLGGCSNTGHGHAYDRLYSPTQITRLNGVYFIVDCWHHRILYSQDVRLPLARWRLLDDDLAGPHSIDTDGKLYVAEDTGRHRLKVYRARPRGGFELIQIVGQVGVRPHRVLYDPPHQQFLIMGSEDQSLHALVRGPQGLRPAFSLHIPELNGEYCRSITLHGDLLYFVAVTHLVIYRRDGHRFRFTGQRLPIRALQGFQHGHGSNDLFFLDQRRGILTATPNRAFLFNHLMQLVDGTAQDISHHFRGTPYYLSVFDGQLWFATAKAYSAISRIAFPDLGPKTLDARNLGLMHRETLFDIGPANQASLDRRQQLPQ
ncbi:MAG: hypothetical protein Q4B17_00455 [Lautropia sp.]|nr:hypothetical protein [Lautropia sp.]